MMSASSGKSESVERAACVILMRLRFRPEGRGRIWRNTYDESLTASLRDEGGGAYSILFRNELNDVEYILHDIASNDVRYTLTANGHYIASAVRNREHEHPYGGNIDLDVRERRLSDLLMAKGFRACPLGDYDDRTRLVRPIRGGAVTAFIHWYGGEEYANLTAYRDGIRDGWTLTFDEADERLADILDRLDAKAGE